VGKEKLDHDAREPDGQAVDHMVTRGREATRSAEVGKVVEAISKTDCGAAGFLPAKK